MPKKSEPAPPMVEVETAVEATATPGHSVSSQLIDRLGRFLITLGLLMLGFVGYQLWGTNLNESRQQNQLERAFEIPKPVLAPPNYGDAVGKISIPSLGVDKFIVAGVDWKSLKKGPGLFPNSPLPCQLGNVALAGHRTTFGAPFARIDELKKDDTIELKTSAGNCTYIVTGPPRIVAPTAVEVISTTDPNKAELTLVSCHPKWTASKRIIVSATIAPTATPQAATPFVPTTEVSNALDGGWFHDPAAIPWVIVYGLAMLIVVRWRRMMLARRYRKSFSAVVLSPLFLPALYFFYENIARLLPTNI